MTDSLEPPASPAKSSHGLGSNLRAALREATRMGVMTCVITSFAGLVTRGSAGMVAGALGGFSAAAIFALLMMPTYRILGLGFGRIIGWPFAAGIASAAGLVIYMLVQGLLVNIMAALVGGIIFGSIAGGLLGPLLGGPCLGEHERGRVVKLSCAFLVFVASCVALITILVVNSE